MDFDELWRRIERYAGEVFYEMGGKRFTYEIHADHLMLSTGRAIPRRDIERVHAQGKITSLRVLKEQGIQSPSPIFSILTDPRLRKE